MFLGEFRSCKAKQESRKLRKRLSNFSFCVPKGLAIDRIDESSKTPVPDLVPVVARILMQLY